MKDRRKVEKNRGRKTIEMEETGKLVKRSKKFSKQKK